MPLEEIVKSLATNTQQFQQETKMSIQNMENQMNQLASVVSHLESQVWEKFPSQTIINPTQNVSAITLGSCKELLEYKKGISKHNLEEQVEEQTMKSPTQSFPRKEPRDEPLVVATPPPPF